MMISESVWDLLHIFVTFGARGPRVTPFLLFFRADSDFDGIFYFFLRLHVNFLYGIGIY